VLISPSPSRQLNEFRKFIGLKPLVSFKQWNPDPTVWKVAERLYKDIDVRLTGSFGIQNSSLPFFSQNLELYVGMQAEEVKKPMPGAGLCPGEA
jgi:linoleate 10R-lipoxygenase